MPLRRLPVSAILLIGLPVLVASVVLSTALGATTIEPKIVLSVLLDRLGILKDGSVPEVAKTVILMIRLPRIVSALLAGCGLAMAGTVMQGLFRNPLAEPGVLGVSSGASLGALLALVSGTGAFFALPFYAFIGAIAAVSIIMLLSLMARGSARTVTLIMSGMAISALFGALTSLVLTLANEYQIASYIFWTMGGLANRRWEHAAAMLGPVLIVMLVLLYKARDLDILLLGDEEARALGVSPGRTRFLLIILASLATAAIVSVTGPIGFVGLIVPHIMRLLVGPAHRQLTIASAIGGSIFLMLCDLVTRLFSRPSGAELSAGIVTAIVGAPYFLFLLFKAARRDGRIT
jgi:iron complex transport system permease protein